MYVYYSTKYIIIYSRLFNSEYEIVSDLHFDFIDFCLNFSVCFRIYYYRKKVILRGKKNIQKELKKDLFTPLLVYYFKFPVS